MMARKKKEVSEEKKPEVKTAPLADAGIRVTPVHMQQLAGIPREKPEMPNKCPHCEETEVDLVGMNMKDYLRKNIIPPVLTGKSGLVIKREVMCKKCGATYWRDD